MSINNKVITSNDLAAVLDEVLPPSGVESWTPTITASTGTLNEAQGYKYGSVYTLRINVQNSSATANGSNVFQGTLSNHIPLITSTGAGFYGGIGAVISIANTGVVTVRNIGSSLGANNAVTVCVTYIA